MKRNRNGLVKVQNVFEDRIDLIKGKSLCFHLFYWELLALLLALVSRWNGWQANAPMFEAPNLPRGIVHNDLYMRRAGFRRACQRRRHKPGKSRPAARVHADRWVETKLSISLNSAHPACSHIRCWRTCAPVSL